MKAALIHKTKTTLSNGMIIEAVIWEVPTPVPPSPHNFKYRLVAILDGERIPGYDNESGKGDHKHIATREVPYTFSTVEALLADFLSDLKGIKND